MAYLQTTYIDGDLFVQNALNVKEIKIDSGSFVPKIDGGDADYDGLLDNFDKKLVVFNGDMGAITKSPISLGDGSLFNEANDMLSSNKSGDATKLLFDVSLHNYDYTTKHLPLGVLLNNVSSENFVIKNTPIYLHEKDGALTWNHTFKDSVQDIIYHEAKNFDLTCITVSEKNPTLDVAFYVNHGRLGENTIVNPFIRKGYSIKSWKLDTVSDTIVSSNTINSIIMTEAAEGTATKDTATLEDTKLSIVVSSLKETPYLLHCNVEPIEQSIKVYEGDDSANFQELKTNVETRVIFGENIITAGNNSINFKNGLAKSFEIYLEKDEKDELLAKYSPGVEIVLPYTVAKIKVIFE